MPGPIHYHIPIIPGNPLFRQAEGIQEGCRVTSGLSRDQREQAQVHGQRQGDAAKVPGARGEDKVSICRRPLRALTNQSLYAKQEPLEHRPGWRKTDWVLCLGGRADATKSKAWMSKARPLSPMCRSQCPARETLVRAKEGEMFLLQTGGARGQAQHLLLGRHLRSHPCHPCPTDTGSILIGHLAFVQWPPILCTALDPCPSGTLGTPDEPGLAPKPSTPKLMLWELKRPLANTNGFLDQDQRRKGLLKELF